jgi:hypothetical protein
MASGQAWIATRRDIARHWIASIPMEAAHDHR